MGDRADAFAAPPGCLGVRGDADRRPDDLAGHVRGVAVARLDAVMIVPGGHEDDRLAVRSLEHAHHVRRDQRSAREHAEVERLQLRERGVVPLNRQHRFVRLNAVTVVEGVDGQIVPVRGAELEDRDRLVDATEMSMALLEDLHHDARPAAIFEQRRPGVIEVRVGVVALPHLLDGELEDLGRQPLLTSFPQLHVPTPGRRRARPRRPRAARGSAPRSPAGAAARGPAWRARARGRCPGCGPSS